MSGYWFEGGHGAGALEKSVVRMYLLESEDRGIKTCEFFEGRKASSSTFSARRTSLNNTHWRKPIIFMQNLIVISTSRVKLLAHRPSKQSQIKYRYFFDRVNLE
jgi:hypothetical protein